MGNKEIKIKVACEKIMKLESESVEIVRENDLQGFYHLTQTFVKPYLKIENDGMVLINNREICKAEDIEDIENTKDDNGIQSVTIFHQKFNDLNESKTVWIIRKHINENKIDVQRGF